MKRLSKSPQYGGLDLNWYWKVFFLTISILRTTNATNEDFCYKHLSQASSTLVDFFYSGVVASENLRACSDICNSFGRLHSGLNDPKQCIELSKLCFCTSKTDGLKSDKIPCTGLQCDSVTNLCDFTGYKFETFSDGPPSFNTPATIEVAIPSIVEVTGTSVNLTSIKYDFGDDYRYRSNKTMVSHTFSTSGYFLLRAVVINKLTSEIVVTAFQEVVPNTNFSNIHFDTPESFETGIPLDNVTLSIGYGLNLFLEVKITFTPTFLPSATTSPLAVDEKMLTDAFTLPIGIAITDDAISATFTPSKDSLIIPPSLFFLESGSVTSFEFHATETGVLIIYILRPDKCISCDVKGTLLNGTKASFDPDLSSVLFTLIKVVMLDIKAKGFQVYDVDSNKIKVRKGDAFGILSPATSNLRFVAEEKMYYKDLDALPQEGDQFNSITVSTNKLPYIRPYLTKTFNHRLEDLPTVNEMGNLTFEVHNESSTLLATKTIPVLDRITDISLHDLNKSYDAVEVTVKLKAMVGTRDRPDTSYTITLTNLSKSINSSDGHASFYQAKWKTGTYEIVIVASNLINTFRKTFNFMIESQIKEFKIVTPEERVEQNKEFTLSFKIIGGTNINFEVDFNDGKTYKKYIDEAPNENYKIKHTYTICKKYEITAHVENLVTDKISDSVSVVNYCEVKGVSVKTFPQKSGNGITLSIKDFIELQIIITSGSEANYFISWGDGSDEKKYFDSFEPKPQTFKKKYPESLLEHKKQTEVTLTGYVWNKVNNVTFNSILIKLQNCSEPPDIKFPYGTKEKPVEFTIGQKMEFIAAWSFGQGCREKVEGNMGHFKCFVQKVPPSVPIDISGASVSDGYKCIVIPKAQGLNVAPYKLTFKMSYGKGAGMKNFTYNGFLNITESELEAIISNGESRDLAQEKRLTRSGKATFYEATIDGSESFDPDDVESLVKDGLEYQWFCRNDSEFISVDDFCKVSNGLWVPLGETKCNTSVIKIDKSLVKINTSCFAINARYSVKLEFSKENERGLRKKETIQKLLIIEGEPPDVDISCVTNCNAKINSKERFAIKYKCDSCFGRRLDAIWEIFDQTSGKKINFGYASATGANLVVPENTLQEGSNFKFTLKTKFVGAINGSSVSLTKKTSRKPYDGECSLDKANGEASKTKFGISCTSWKYDDEDDRPTQYEFRYDMGAKDGSNNQPLLNPDSLSRPAVSNVLFPQGFKENDYKIQLKIRIINKYGAFAEYDKLSVQVKPFTYVFPSQPLPSEEGEKNETETDSTEAQMQGVFDSLSSNQPKNENDTQAVTAFVTSAVSVIQVLELGPPPTLAPTAAAGLFGKLDTVSEEDKQAKKNQKKAEQKEKTKFKENMVKLLKKAPVRNIQQLKAVADSLSTVTADKDTVSDDTQGNAIDMLFNMKDVLKAAAKDKSVGANYLEQSTKNYVQSISNLFQVEKPVHETVATPEKEKEKVGDEGKVTETDGKAAENTTVVKESEEEKRKKKAEKTEQNVNKLVSTLNVYFEVISENKVTGEKPSRGKTDSFDFALKKINSDYFENVTVESEDEDESGIAYGFQLPNMTALFSSLDDGADIQLENVNFKNNIFSWDLNRSADVKTEVTSLKIKTRGSAMDVSNLAEPITITIKNKPELLQPLNVSLFLPGDLAFNTTSIDTAQCNMLINFNFLNDPENVTTFFVYIQYGNVASSGDYDVMLRMSRTDGIEMTKSKWANCSYVRDYNENSTVCNDTAVDDALPRVVNAEKIDNWTIMLYNFDEFHWAKISNKSKLFFTYYYEGPMPKRRFESNIYTDDLIEYRGAFNFSVRSFCTECAYWNENSSKWSSEGCKVDPNSTSLSKTTCLCNHLTSFGGFYVAPNPLPTPTWAMLAQGYVLLVTVGTILLLYIVGLVVARRADKNDLKKIGVCPLMDNNPENKYLYEITVNTGSRRNAGTKSNVFFNASGDLCDSGVHHLTDPEREVFQTNSSDVFIMSTPNTIGDINYIRVWHDNTGDGWYLRSIEVIDLQTEEKFLFITTRWLAVDKHDGTIDAIIPVCGKEELTDFNYLFTNKSKRELSDAHIWFSIYARPPRSSFTRCQRLSVAISLLFCSMLASCMFYRTSPSGSAQEENRIGGFSFRWEQVFVALIGACITVPVNLILVGLFRIINPSPAPAKVIDTATESDTSINNIEDASDPMSSLGSTKLIENEKSKKRKIDEGKKRKKAFYLPHWCIYPTWFLCIAVILGSGFIVVWYGMVFGNKKSLDWLASVTICLFQDILLIQPLKVFAMALFIALIVKKLDEEEKSELEKNVKTLSKNESWLHKLRNEATIFDRVEVIEPPDLSVLENMRGVRLKEMKMAAISREMMLYFMFTLVVFMIGYNLRDQNAYNQTLDIKELFKLSVRNPDSKSFKPHEVFGKLQSYQEFWDWTDVVLLKELYPEEWYKDELTQKLQKSRFNGFPGRIYLNDLNSKIVNGVRLRQMRVREDSCKKAPDVKQFITIDCADAFSTYNEEKRGFDYNWSKPLGSYKTKLNQMNKPWRYQDSSALDTYLVMANLNSYVGGGYVVELFPKFENKKILDILKAKQWIDRHTRALVVEFATYNAQTNYFDMVMIVFEFPPSGGLVHYSSVQTFRLSQYTNETAFFVIGCYILYLLFMLVFTIREVRIVYRVGLKYFKEFWNLVEMGNILLSLAGVFVYFYLNYLRKTLLSRLPHKVPNVFINFHWASMWYDGLIHIIALVCFFVTLKFIKILRFNKRISMLSSTLKVAWYPLAMFAIMFFIIIAAVVFSATIIFGHTLYGYRNWLATASAVFSLLLGKFSYYQFESTNIVLGPIFFFSFNIMVNWIIMNMFISILNDVFACVQAEILEQENEYEMFDYMMGQIKGWLGFKTRFAETEKTTDEYFDSKMNKAVMASDTSLPYHSKSKRSGSENSLNKSQHWRAEKLFVDDSKFLMEEDVSEKFVDETVDKFVKCINMLYFNDATAGKKVSIFAKSEIKDN